MYYAIAALLALIADQALKYYVTLNIPLGDGVITLIPGFMSLVNYHNTGAAFSMLSGGGARWAFVVLAVSFTAAVIYLIVNRKIPSNGLRWTLTMIAAGAMGNAIDRAFYGYVVDMFRTDFMNFAIFNVADIFITVGGFLLCIAILLMPSEKTEKDLAYEEEYGEERPESERNPGVKLFSEKPQLPDEVAERRRTGKLYGEKKPFDAENPFAEFEQMPTKFEKVKKPSVEALEQDAKETRELDQLTKKLQEEMSLEAILDEFGDGTV